jgi:hypothetical protein
MAGEGCGAKREGVHAAPLAAGALSTSATATSTGAARKARMARVYPLAGTASRSPGAESAIENTPFDARAIIGELVADLPPDTLTRPGALRRRSPRAPGRGEVRPSDS